MRKECEIVECLQSEVTEASKSPVMVITTFTIVILI